MNKFLLIFLCVLCTTSLIGGEFEVLPTEVVEQIKIKSAAAESTPLLDQSLACDGCK